MSPVNEAGDTHPDKGNEPLRGFFIRAGSKNRRLHSPPGAYDPGRPQPKGPAYSSPTLPSPVLSHVTCHRYSLSLQKGPWLVGSPPIR